MTIIAGHLRHEITRLQRLRRWQIQQGDLEPLAMRLEILADQIEDLERLLGDDEIGDAVTIELSANLDKQRAWDD